MTPSERQTRCLRALDDLGTSGKRAGFIKNATKAVKTIAEEDLDEEPKREEKEEGSS